MSRSKLVRFHAVLCPWLVGCLLLTGSALAGPRSWRGGAPVVVDSAEDGPVVPSGPMTLRRALAAVRPGGRIVFAPALDGAVIELTEIDEPHSVLLGESYSGGPFQGFVERDYGASALYARKSVTIDASSLPHGITLQWRGGESQARVLAVYGDLTLVNVAIIGGRALAEPTGSEAQPYTLARGGGLAVWGTATLRRCTISDNRVAGDEGASRDRGAFGGGVYADRLLLYDSVVTRNRAVGYGAAGGGVYSVGGRGTPGRGSEIRRSAVADNSVVAQHAYGGGVFSEGGGPGRRETLLVEASSLLGNSVEDNEAIGEPQGSQYYYRGGGLYMTNGSVKVAFCTVAFNHVDGIPATFRERPNMGGGGLGATIGNAHVVETMELWNSIVAGNTVRGTPEDIFTGSLLHFFSYGNNRVGVIDFDHMLVPVPVWGCLSRKHWPEQGDRDGVPVASVLDLDHPYLQPPLRTGSSDTVIGFPPRGDAVDAVSRRRRAVPALIAEFSGPAGTFLESVLAHLRTNYREELGDDFGSGFGDVSAITFTPTPETWPSEPANAEWIAFWRDLDAEIDGRLGAAGLNDDFWADFEAPAGSGVTMLSSVVYSWHRALGFDQFGRKRGLREPADVGAVEYTGGLPPGPDGPGEDAPAVEPTRAPAPGLRARPRS